MRYREFKPTPILSPFVECIWVLEDNHAVTQVERIVPDGKPELIIHYKECTHEFNVKTGQWSRQGRILFAGHRKGHLLLRVGLQSGMLGVRFHPAGAAQFLKVSMSNTTDLVVDLLDWNPKCVAALENQVMEASGERDRLRIVVSFLEKKLLSSRPDLIISEIANFIHRSGGNIDYKDLVSKFDIGERQVERRFACAVGIGPKQLARTIRFQRVLKEKEKSPSIALTDIAMNHGYYDQSHFSREFKGFTGLSPKAYFNERHQMNNFFI